MRRPHLAELPAIPEPPAGYVLRTFRPSDLPGLTRLMQAAFPEMAWDEAQTFREFCQSPHIKQTFLLEWQGEIVATATALLEPETYPGTGVVHWVAVSPEHRGQHLGYLVSLVVLHSFVLLGCYDSLLRTDPPRLPAIKTYQKLGFQKVERG